MTDPAYDIICSIGELIDKLSISNVKCYDANTKILAERAKPQPDHHLISSLEFNARKAGEERVKLRSAINQRLAEALQRGRIDVAPDVRTYTDQLERVKQ